MGRRRTRASGGGAPSGSPRRTPTRVSCRNCAIRSGSFAPNSRRSIPARSPRRRARGGGRDDGACRPTVDAHGVRPSPARPARRTLARVPPAPSTVPQGAARRRHLLVAIAPDAIDDALADMALAYRTSFAPNPRPAGSRPADRTLDHQQPSAPSSSRAPKARTTNSRPTSAISPTSRRSFAM